MDGRFDPKHGMSNARETGVHQEVVVDNGAGFREVAAAHLVGKRLWALGVEQARMKMRDSLFGVPSKDGNGIGG